MPSKELRRSDTLRLSELFNSENNSALWFPLKVVRATRVSLRVTSDELIDTLEIASCAAAIYKEKKVHRKDKHASDKIRTCSLKLVVLKSTASPTFAICV